MKHTKILLSGLFALLMIPFLIACGGSSSSVAGVQTGTVAFNLTDLPGDYQAVYVTVKEVQVHLSASETEETNSTDDVAEDQNTSDDSGWKVLATSNTTYNLLELQNGVEVALGEGNLTVGHYTQIRLVLGTEADEGNNTLELPHEFPNYVIDNNGEIAELTVPSGFQSGIKLIKGFDVQADVTTELTLDFDADKSVSLTNDGTYKMKPTIKIIQK